MPASVSRSASSKKNSGCSFFSAAANILSISAGTRAEVLEVAKRILGEVENIRPHRARAQRYRARVASHRDDPYSGALRAAADHQALHRNLSRCHCTCTRGTPLQISELAANRSVDFAIATEALELFDNLVMLPCYRWNRNIIVPEGHPLIDVETLTLEAIAAYPIVTYVFGFTGRSQLDRAFADAGLEARVVFTAVDADVIKTYVRLGLGVGIVATLAYDAAYDKGLVALNASHLFDYSVTKIGFRRGAYLRAYMYDFIRYFAPHLTRDVVDEAIAVTGKEEFAALFDESELPEH